MPRREPPTKGRRTEQRSRSDAASVPKEAFSIDYQRWLTTDDGEVRLSPSALHHAVSHGDGGDVALLICHGANVNAMGDRVGNTPLHLAAQEGCAEKAKLLLENGAMVNAVDDSDCTALHDAVERGHVAVVNVLLEHGADVNAKNDRSRAPLHVAAAGKSRNHRTAAGITRILLDHGANIAAEDNNGRTPLYTAARHRADVVQVLIDRGADVNARNDFDDTSCTQLSTAPRVRCTERTLSKHWSTTVPM